MWNISTFSTVVFVILRLIDRSANGVSRPSKISGILLNSVFDE